MSRRKGGPGTKHSHVSLRVPLLDTEPIAVLDLHGSTANEAARKTEFFLQRQLSGSVVHIITGRGLGSNGRPVLGPRVRALLDGQLGPLVEEFEKDLDQGGFFVRRR